LESPFKPDDEVLDRSNPRATLLLRLARVAALHHKEYTYLVTWGNVERSEVHGDKARAMDLSRARGLNAYKFLDENGIVGLPDHKVPDNAAIVGFGFVLPVGTGWLYENQHEPHGRVDLVLYYTDADKIIAD
jgi:hypothetical protein